MRCVNLRFTYLLSYLYGSGQPWAEDSLMTRPLTRLSLTERSALTDCQTPVYYLSYYNCLFDASAKVNLFKQILCTDCVCLCVWCSVGIVAVQGLLDPIALYKVSARRQTNSCRVQTAVGCKLQLCSTV